MAEFFADPYWDQHPDDSPLKYQARLRERETEAKRRGREVPKPNDQGDPFTNNHLRHDDSPCANDRFLAVEPMQSTSQPLQFIDVAAWQDCPIPRREWAVIDRIPQRNVTLFSGDGAIGKTLLLLQLSIATCAGKDWLGVIPARGPSMAILCEDEEPELHARCAAIVEYYGTSFADLPDLHLLSPVGKDTLMGAPDRNGIIQRPPKPTRRTVRS